jgi:hypothetical protein
MARIGMSGDPYAMDAVNWANISGGGTYAGSNANQTISGIKGGSTNLRVTYTQNGLYSLGYHKNGGGFVALATGDTFSVSNTDTIHFEAIGDNVDPVIGATATVTNANGRQGTVDTFSVALG